MQLRDIALVLTGLGITVWVAVLLWRRKLYREFPFFFFYIALSTVFPLVRLSVSGDYRTYFWTFWITEAIYALAALLALHEVFHEVFFGFYELWWWFRLVFPGTASVIVLISICNAIRHPVLQWPRYLEVIFALAKGVNYVGAALFGVFFLLVVLLGVRWRSYPFGIVEGFGLYALGSWVAFGLRSEFGKKYNTLAKYGPAMAYLVGVLVWLDTFRREPEPEAGEAWREQVTPQQMLAEARSYLRVLKKFFGHNDS